MSTKKLIRLSLILINKDAQENVNLPCTLKNMSMESPLNGNP